MASEISRELLGDSLQTILDAKVKNTHRVSEYQFEQEIADLLSNPFDPENLRRYEVYVGELTRELNIYQGNDPDDILFTVPALFQTPRTTIPRTNGMTADAMLASLRREQELGGFGVPEKLVVLLSGVTRTPGYVETVLLPIRNILRHFNRELVDVPAMRGLEPEKTNITSSKDIDPNGFLDEYQD